jgi:hypothetical protein
MADKQRVLHDVAKLARNMWPHLVGALRGTCDALEDAGIRLQDVHKTAVGIFVAGQVSFLPSPDAPDETTLRANIGSSLADSVSTHSGYLWSSKHYRLTCPCLGDEAHGCAWGSRLIPCSDGSKGTW